MVVGVWAVLVTPFAAHVQPERLPPDRLASVLIGVAAAGLVIRRARPLVSLAAVVLPASVYLVLGYVYGPIMVLPLIAMYTVARLMPIRRSLVACGIALAVLFVHAFVTVGRGAVAPPLPWAGWLLVPWAAGTVVRMYRESAARAREEMARDRAYEERLRIAREVHDVVGHGLAAINMQAGVALHVLDRRPEKARDALDAIRQTSKAALDDLRGTLAVFRQPDGGERSPTPGLDQLDALVQRITEGGVPVDLEITGDPARLPAATDLAAYRIVQESLTNVVKHAGPTSASVRVHYGPDEVELEVTDEGRARPGAEVSSTGYGIPGMGERASAVGGTLETGPRAGGGFRVHARLPLETNARLGGS